MEDTDTMTALVVGGADCVWDDLDAFWALAVDPDHVIAVNDIGVDLDRVDHWASLHPDRLAGWEHKRGDKDWTSWTAPNKDHYGLVDDYVEHPGGSSGGLAVAVALHLGADRVVMAGCPLLARHAHYFDRPQPFDEAGRFRKQWVENGLTERWQGIVTSMSGWTRDQMGAPTRAWLLGETDGHETAA